MKSWKAPSDALIWIYQNRVINIFEGPGSPNNNTITRGFFYSWTGGARAQPTWTQLWFGFFHQNRVECFINLFARFPASRPGDFWVLPCPLRVAIILFLSNSIALDVLLIYLSFCIRFHSMQFPLRWCLIPCKLKRFCLIDIEIANG